MNDRTKQLKILLIEDNPVDALLLEEILKEADFWCHITSVSLLSSGMEKVKTEAFDVIFLDLGLPDSQGLSTLLKLSELKPESPVIVLTGMTDEALGVQAVKGGAEDYLIKGEVDKNLLVRSINYAMERRRNRETLQKYSRELERKNKELEESLCKVKLLSGFLPICASCKKIRDDSGYWNQIETYISEHSETQFSHGICPDCAKKTYAELEELKSKEKK